MTDLRELLVAEPGTVRLADIDPRSTPGLPDRRLLGGDPKLWSRAQVTSIGQLLAGYQERLFASAKAGATHRRVLLVLQAMDCGGKDGTVRSVAQAMNPAGLRAISFGPPSEEELRHDFLWRIRAALPSAGQVAVFNRSHYEDVLVVRVHGLVPETELAQRYDVINDFEAELADDGLTIVKVMLHISPEEQRKRLLARLDDPTKHWKYNPGDLDERQRWDEYQAAYDDAINRCSTEAAPWYVVPADRKWYRNWAVANLLRQAFEDINPQYPPAEFDVAAERERLLAVQDRGSFTAPRNRIAPVSRSEMVNANGLSARNMV